MKGNRPLAHAAVVEHFDQRCFRVDTPCRADCDAFDDTHGRLVRRWMFASTEAAALAALSGWPGLAQSQSRAYVLRYAVALGNAIATEFCDMFVIRSASWPFSDL